MAKKEVDGEGLNIPNRIKALPVKRPGPIVAAVIVVLLAAISIFFAGINIFGGFLVTRRMLAMFQKS